MARLFAILALIAGGAGAQDRAGDFDHYVLALSWSPTWCAGAGRDDAPQCAPRRDLGFIVHGLWPQRADGWPEQCPTDRPGPTRAETAAMADVMGSAGLAFAQWRKHGRCTGLDGAAYLRLTRRAAGAVRVPEALRRPAQALRASPEAVEAAFLAANPAMTADGVTVLCDEGRLREVRLCLTTGLAPRPCAQRAARDCRARTLSIPPPP